jgi:hypothetical protein
LQQCFQLRSCHFITFSIAIAAALASAETKGPVKLPPKLPPAFIAVLRQAECECLENEG